VYAADKLGRLHVLSAPTGSPVAVLPTESLPLKVANAESDRIFMASPTGTLLCLHEVELSQKVSRHEAATEPEEVFDTKLAPKTGGEEKSAEQPAAKTPSSTPRSAPSGGGTPRPSGSKKAGKGGVAGATGGYPVGSGKTGKRSGSRSGRGSAAGAYPGGVMPPPGMMPGVPPAGGRAKQPRGAAPPPES
jgi:hypothetical protein